MTAMVLVALIALVLVVVCNVAWLLIWSRRRNYSGPNQVQVAGDNSTLISGTNITITATNGSLAAHTLDGDVTVGHGKVSVSSRRAGTTRDGRVWEAPPDTKHIVLRRERAVRIPLDWYTLPYRRCRDSPGATSTTRVRTQLPRPDLGA